MCKPLLEVLKQTPLTREFGVLTKCQLWTLGSNLSSKPEKWYNLKSFNFSKIWFSHLLNRDGINLVGLVERINQITHVWVLCFPGCNLGYPKKKILFFCNLRVLTLFLKLHLHFPQLMVEASPLENSSFLPCPHTGSPKNKRAYILLEIPVLINPRSALFFQV